MNRKLGCGTLVFVTLVATAWYIGSGTWKSENQRFAENTCDPYERKPYPQGSYRACILQNFQLGTDVGRLQKYLDGAGFIRWNHENRTNGFMRDYVLIKDNEIRANRIRIRFVSDSRYRVISIDIFQGEYVGG